MFCKHILGVRKSTSINGMLLELGRCLLYLSANKAAIKNWERIRIGEANLILSSSFSDSINLGLNSTEKIRSFMSGIGMLDCFLYGGLYSTPIYKLSSIANENSKLRTYNLIKTDIGFENYLTKICEGKHRQALSKLHISDHDLMIEKGRYKKIPKAERLGR